MVEHAFTVVWIDSMCAPSFHPFCNPFKGLTVQLLFLHKGAAWWWFSATQLVNYKSKTSTISKESVPSGELSQLARPGAEQLRLLRQLEISGKSSFTTVAFHVSYVSHRDLQFPWNYNLSGPEVPGQDHIYPQKSPAQDTQSTSLGCLPWELLRKFQQSSHWSSSVFIYHSSVWCSNIQHCREHQWYTPLVGAIILYVLSICYDYLLCTASSFIYWRNVIISTCKSLLGTRMS